MAGDSAAPTPDDLVPLTARLGEPAPLCVALVAVDAGGGADDPTGSGRMGGRELAVLLGRTLRPYDEVLPLGHGWVAVLLPTLAGTDDLERRLVDLFDRVRGSLAATSADGPVPFVVFGAAARTPSETPDQFVTRLIGAVDRAMGQRGRTPVII